MKFLALILVTVLFTNTVFAAGENTYSAEWTNTANKNLVASDSTSLSITDDLSIQFAIKPDGSLADAEGIMGMYGSSPQRSYFIQLDTNLKLRLIITDSGGTRTDFVANTALSTSAWTCVMFTFDPSTEVTYNFDEGCDNALVEDLSDTTSIPANNRNSTEDFYIGAFGAFPASANNVYDGRLDDIRIWNEIHDASSDYNCQIVGDETNLNAYWQLNNSLLDETSNNNDLTNNSSVDIADTDVPFSDDCAGAAAAPGVELIIIVGYMFAPLRRYLTL